MIEKGLYYLNDEFRLLVQSVGGEWNDTKHRPVVCLIESTEQNGLYWAIPMGNFNHRTDEQKDRLFDYINLPERDIRSCYYHIGRTTTKSIFFISDAVPVTDKYIESEHVDWNKNHYIIKNKNLNKELERKLLRILSVENSRPDGFRQHITSVKKALIKELNDKQNTNQD